MANENRVHYNFLDGRLNVTMDATTTTMNGLGPAPAVGANDHLPLVIDPEGVNGPPEIVYLVSHVAGADAGTVVRAQEGTTARLHAPGESWTNSPMASDMALTAHQRAALAAQTVMSSNARFRWDGANLNWNARLIPISVGRGGHWGSSGYYDFNMPAAGVVIPGFGGAGNATVNSAGIPLAAWHALWAVPTRGGSNTAYSYAITSYTPSTFVVPNHWIFIAVHNGDAQRVQLWNGTEVDKWRPGAYVNGWTTYDATYAPARYKRENGVVTIQGLVRSGTVGATIFTLPVGYRPNFRLLFDTQSNGALGRFDVDAAGNVIAVAGSNVWFSLGSTSFPADQ